MSPCESRGWGQREVEEGKEDKEESQPARTFPEPPESFLSGDGSIGIHSALVSSASSGPCLSLEADLHHVCGLGHSHSEGTCGAACQEAASEAGICGYTAGEGIVSSGQQGLALIPPTWSHL